MDESTTLPPEAAAHGVSFDGRAYHYQGYTYERLIEALAYARLDQGGPGLREVPAPRRWKQWTQPTRGERLQMDAQGIEYRDGYYRYGPYRYDVLSAALAYARQEPGLSCPRGVEND